MRLLERDLASRYATAEKASEALAGCVDASLRSRSELARLMAERFPQESSSRASRSPLGPPPSDRIGISSSRTPTRPLAPSSAATSLSLAASESMQPSLHVPRRRRLLAGVAISVIASGAVGVVVGIFGRHDRPPVEPAAVASPPPNRAPSPPATGATIPAQPMIASDVTAPLDAMVPTNTSAVAPPPDANPDAAVLDALPILDATPPVAVTPAASPSTTPVIRPSATTPAKVTKSPRAVPARRSGPADSDDVGGD